MNQHDIIQAFSKLGAFMKSLCDLETTNEELDLILEVIKREKHYNGWFTEDSIYSAIDSLSNMLNREKMEQWVSSYTYTSSPKRVGIIMAGNIPLVGFHDLLCVVISGHHAVVKMSSDDGHLLPIFLKKLTEFDSRISSHFSLEDRLSSSEAVIATGSNNSAMYFEKYFGNQPNIIRRNRTSIAILDGTETAEEMVLLGKDVFSYFGLGCRNVSQLFLPKDMDINRFFAGIVGYNDIVNHNKYANNYDYYKAIYLMNQEKLLENGFLLTKESDELFSPIAVLYYKRYEDKQELQDFLATNSDKIQAVIGHDYIPFGQAQHPSLSDYADGVDTMDFLQKI
jgi:hypothetical protein